MQVFANAAVHVQSWYVVARSSELRRGQVFSRELLGRRIALLRGADGRVRALGARCAHLGADLGRGHVVGNDLRCAFHHWTYGEDGRCLRVPSLDAVPPFARTPAYPVAERHGCVWIFAGDAPSFPLPTFEGWRDEDLHVSRLPPRVMDCHPHLAVMNGLDVEHFKTVHQLDFVDEPQVRAVDAYRVQAQLNVLLRASGVAARALRLLGATRFTGRFTTWGGNLATVEGRVGRVPLLVLFTHRPLEGGRSASQTFLFAPRARGWGAPAVLVLGIARSVMAYLLGRDRDVLEAVAFRPRLVPADAPLAAFIRQVEGMPVLPAPEDDAGATPARP